MQNTFYLLQKKICAIKEYILEEEIMWKEQIKCQPHRAKNYRNFSTIPGEELFRFSVIMIAV